jgi:hypothetical protein
MNSNFDEIKNKANSMRLSILEFHLIFLILIISLKYHSNAQDFKRVEKNAGYHESFPNNFKVNFKEKRCYKTESKDTSQKYLEYIIKYDKKGNEIEKHEFWVHNETIEKYLYDTIGRKVAGTWIETKFYDEYGNLIPEETGKFVYDYDNQGNLILEKKLILTEIQ